MNFTETFQEFSSKLTSMDIALYAGGAMILWVLFKDKLGGLTNIVSGLFQKTKSMLPTPKTSVEPVVSAKEKEDVFFHLVASWKKTRDLAVLSGCEKAVEAADAMFPHLSPVVCKGVKDESVSEVK